MSERVSPLSSSDMSSLLAERGPIHVHVGATVILEGDPPPFDQLLEHVDSRLNLVPRYRQRVLEVPAHLANPLWVGDPEVPLYAAGSRTCSRSSRSSPWPGGRG